MTCPHHQPANACLECLRELVAKQEAKLQHTKADNRRLREAIEAHYNQHADDLCWLDDAALYEAAGLPPKLPEVGDPKAMLRNCKRFIRQRCFAGGDWKSYADLEAENAALLELVSRQAAELERLRQCPRCGGRGIVYTKYPGASVVHKLPCGCRERRD